MNRFSKFIIYFLLATPSIGVASLENELEDFFDYLGASSNFNSADIYNGQKAGYATGGSATIRNRSTGIHPVTVNMPRLDAGCGGIDLFTGGFSFINSDQLVQAAKSIGSNAVGYAFFLGIETVSPQISNNLRQLQTWSNNINSMNIGSCELASQMVGSVWPKDAAVKDHICKTVGTGIGFFDDNIVARQGCGNSNNNNQIQNEVKDKNPEALVSNYNIAWEAIQKQGLIAKDPAVTELLITLMGTLIINEKGGEVFSAKATNSDFLKAMIEGGDTQIYSCRANDNPRCLYMHERKTTIDPNRSWRGKVLTLLSSIQEKILTDEELSKEEQELLSKIEMPIYKFLNVITAYKKGVCPIDLAQIADVIAVDLLVKYLREAVENTRTACRRIRSNAIYADKIDLYVDSLHSIDRNIAYYTTQASMMIQREIYLLEKMELIEAHIAHELCL